MQKLLELTSSNEHIIIDYGSSLCLRAKTMQGCPLGNLTTRKSTKLNYSVAKYAKYCFALHMFCSGDSSYLSDVFDKSKHGTSEFPKTSLIELRSVVQTLLQRVSKLEETHITDTKHIQSLDKTVSSLKSKNASLTSELEKLRNNLDTHASGCETFRKTTNSQLKCLDGLDFTEYRYQVKNNKLNAAVSRLSKLCSGLQKQVSEIKTTKSFATVVSSTSTPSMLHSTHTSHNGNLHFDDHIQKPSQSDSSSAVVQNVLEKPH